ALFGEFESAQATNSVCSLPPCGGGLGRGVVQVPHQRCLTRRPPPLTPPHKGEGNAASSRRSPASYDCGFHSRARFCASGSWSDDISPATVSRFLTAAVRLRVSLAGKRAAARLNHICASTAFCVTPSPRA